MTVRELNGWSPAQVTYDADGNVLSVTVQEPRFTVEEKMLLLASRRREAQPRGGHGILLADATHPDNVNEFVVPDPVADFAQIALDRAKKKYRDRWGDDAMDGLLWRVEQKPTRGA